MPTLLESSEWMKEGKNEWIKEWMNEWSQIRTWPQIGQKGAVPGLTRGQARQGYGSKEMNGWKNEWMEEWMDE